MVDEAVQQLPQPDQSAISHSKNLCEALKPLVQARGENGFSFYDYMQFVLYAPGYGYYSAGNQKFGAKGDFITSPELTPLFGATVAQQIREVLLVTNGHVLEVGAGSGALGLSIAQAIADELTFTYYIFEPSAELRQRQQDLLQRQLTAQQFQRFKWLSQLPNEFTGLIIANEVMDAFPVERFMCDDGVLQCYVDEDLKPSYRKASPELCQRVIDLEEDLGRSLPSGYTSEVSPLLKPWLNSLADLLETGVILLFDYGYPRREYYSEERHCGTLQCFYQHRAHSDPFLWPGLQDITAHVDFTAVAEVTSRDKLDLLGYASQAAFLIDNQLLELAEKELQKSDSDVDRILLSKQIQALTLPGEMGERFQVIALGKHYESPLVGFQTQDLSYRL